MRRLGVWCGCGQPNPGHPSASASSDDLDPWSLPLIVGAPANARTSRVGQLGSRDTWRGR